MPTRRLAGTEYKESAHHDQYQGPDMPPEIAINEIIVYQKGAAYQKQHKPGCTIKSVPETDKKTQGYQ
jgi:hypothetical protein